MPTFEIRHLTPNTLALVGELALSHAQRAHTALRAALSATDTLELDLGAVERCDTAGVQLLIAAWNEARATNKVLRFSRPSSSVRRTFDLLRLSSMFSHPAA
jgi:anti-anti-sigma factor